MSGDSGPSLPGAAPLPIPGVRALGARPVPGAGAGPEPRRWKFGRGEENTTSPGVTPALGGCRRCIPSFSVKFTPRRCEGLWGKAGVPCVRLCREMQPRPPLGAGPGHVAVPQFPFTARQEPPVLSHGRGHHLAPHRCGIRGGEQEGAVPVRVPVRAQCLFSGLSERVLSVPAAGHAPV